jgi:hypothetical protein
MYKIPSLILLLLVSSGCFAQVIGKADKKTKEFTIAANQKIDYTVYGYQFANATTPKFICFSTNQDVVRANSNDKLGAYFDTFRMPPGDKIVYMGLAGTFIKLNYISGGGAKTVFYLPKANFTIK